MDESQKASGLSKAALITGIFGFIPGCSLAALICGIIDLVKINNGQSGSAGKGVSNERCKSWQSKRNV